MSSNNISAFSSNAFNELRKLNHIAFSHNQIHQIYIHDFHFDTIHTNLHIDLSHNEIKKIEFKDLHRFGGEIENLTVNLNFNPVVCDCHLYKFVEFIQNRTKMVNKIFQTEKLYCSDQKKVHELDLNELKCKIEQNFSTKCSFYVRQEFKEIVADCSNLNLSVMENLTEISKSDFVDVQYDKHPEEISTKSFKNITIYFGNNKIEEFDRKLLPKNLNISFLDLQNNSLKIIDPKSLEGIQNIVLIGNNLTCDCETRSLQHFMKANEEKFHKISEIYCESGTHLILATEDELCPSEKDKIVIFLSVLAVLMLTLGLLGVLFYNYNHIIKVHLYAHNICQCCFSQAPGDYQFDAFISFAHEDEDFVHKQLMPRLEAASFRLCIHSRDWVGGEFIVNQVIIYLVYICNGH